MVKICYQDKRTTPTQVYITYVVAVVNSNTIYFYCIVLYNNIAYICNVTTRLETNWRVISGFDPYFVQILFTYDIFFEVILTQLFDFKIYTRMQKNKVS